MYALYSTDVLNDLNVRTHELNALKEMDSGSYNIHYRTHGCSFRDFIRSQLVLTNALGYNKRILKLYT